VCVPVCAVSDKNSAHAVHLALLNHRASVLASPTARTQIGFIQQVQLRDDDDRLWFSNACAQLYQRQFELILELLAPYADGVPMRAGLPFCAPGAAPFVLVVPRVATMLCDIVERRFVSASTSNTCTLCGEAVSAAATSGKVGDGELAILRRAFRGQVCAVVKTMPCPLWWRVRRAQRNA
jgi:hypothetical protein